MKTVKIGRCVRAGIVACFICFLIFFGFLAGPLFFFGRLSIADPAPLNVRIDGTTNLSWIIWLIVAGILGATYALMHTHLPGSTSMRKWATLSVIPSLIFGILAANTILILPVNAVISLIFWIAFWLVWGVLADILNRSTWRL